MSIWSGRFHFTVEDECDLEYLRGAKGGYVYAAAVGNNKEDFIAKVNRALNSKKLTGDTESDDIKNITAEFDDGDLSADWMERCRLAIETQEVAFATFRLYDD